MSNTIINVSLSFCCQENWEGFESITERERFCASCKHRVVDFTSATADDLRLAKREGGSLCGRFTRSQMSAAFLIGLTASGVVSACSEPEVTPKPKEPAALTPVPVLAAPVEKKSEDFAFMGFVAFTTEELPNDPLVQRIREDAQKLSK